MKRAIIFSIIFGFTSHTALAGLELTTEQYENLDVLHYAVKSEQADFIGFNGPRTDMRVVGTVSETDVRKIINRTNVQAKILEMQAAKPVSQEMVQARSDLKAAGLKDATIDLLLEGK